jgi:hypothetical protein
MMTSDAAGHPFTEHVQYYFLAADMAAHAHDTTPPSPAFQVLNAATAETQPLMGVLYENSHIELAVGPERYRRALSQGNGPLWHLEWAGLTRPTTLVVEALATGCPFQGMLSAQHLEAPGHQTLYTLAELQGRSPTGEVFVNGQYDAVSAAPVPLARSYINVAPQPESASAWDFYQGFAPGTDFGPVANMTPCTWQGCSGQTPAFDFAAYELDQPMDGTAVFTFGAFQGQLWTVFDDTGQDVTGRVRFTARTPATVAADRYLHVRMSVNIVSTDRRYPQMIVTDLHAPIDCYTNDCNGIGTANSNVILLQPILGPAMRLEVQAIHGLVNGHPWNVNNQAHEHRLLDGNANYALSQAAFAALNSTSDDTFEHAGVDRMTRFDAYISSQRMYVYMDGAPAGCTLYPAGFALGGPVSVTWGDVLYHEGATDELVCSQERPFGFLHRHQCQETSRHFDDLGFQSGAALPAWDEARVPCNPY